MLLTLALLSVLFPSVAPRGGGFDDCAGGRSSYAIVSAVDVQPAGTVRVRGKVYWLGSPPTAAQIAGTGVGLFEGRVAADGSMNVADVSRSGASVRSDGTFSVSERGPGTWALIVTAPGYCPVTLLTRASITVEVQLVRAPPRP